MNRIRFPAVVLPALAALLPALAPERAAAQPDERAFREAAAYSHRHGGRALLVMRGDSVVFEAYHDGWRADRPHPLASGTKSFACLLGAAAVTDGLLEWDEPVGRTVPELLGDRQAAGITVRNLLGLTSGIQPETRGADGSRPANLYARSAYLPMQARPGERWAYGGAAFDLFGELMRRKLAGRGEDPLAYLERRIFAPLGIRHGGWIRDGAGNPLFAGGASMTARDWAAFGRMVRDGGRWGDSAVVGRDALAGCFRGSTARPDYGLAWWLSTGTWLPVDAAAAVGAGGQLLVIVPSLDFVIVRFGRGGDAGFTMRGFLGRLLGMRPLPADAAPGGLEN